MLLLLLLGRARSSGDLVLRDLRTDWRTFAEFLKIVDDHQGSAWKAALDNLQKLREGAPVTPHSAPANVASAPNPAGR